MRDLVAGTTTLVSRASGPGGAAADAAAHDAGHLGRRALRRLPLRAPTTSRPRTTTASTNIFVRDLIANTTTLVSRRAGAGGAGANDSSFNPAISGDGNRVAFQSGANNLSNEDNNAVVNVFVRDIDAATSNAGQPCDGARRGPRQRRLGQRQHLAFGPLRDFPVHWPTTCRRTTTTPSPTSSCATSTTTTTALISRGSGPGGAGGDAASVDRLQPSTRQRPRGLLLEREQPVGRRQRRLLQRLRARRDRQHDRAGEPGTGRGRKRRPTPPPSPSTSQDGRYVAFQLLATNLATGTIPGVRNIYRRDVLGDTPIATPGLQDPAAAALAAAERRTSPSRSRSGSCSINQRISQAAIRRLNAVEAPPQRRPGRPRPVRLLDGAAPAGARHHQRPGGGLAGPGGPGRPGRRSSTPAAAARATR